MFRDAAKKAELDKAQPPTEDPAKAKKGEEDQNKKQGDKKAEKAKKKEQPKNEAPKKKEGKGREVKKPGKAKKKTKAAPSNARNPPDYLNSNGQVTQESLEFLRTETIAPSRHIPEHSHTELPSSWIVRGDDTRPPPGHVTDQGQAHRCPRSHAYGNVYLEDSR